MIPPILLYDCSSQSTTNAAYGILCGMRINARLPPGAGRVLFASMIGTTIEFFDFYIFATAAVLVFPRLFFAAGDPTAAMLQSLATFALAFFARPIGSAVFGHFGDRIGRKK